MLLSPWIRHGWIGGEGVATSQGTLRASCQAPRAWNAKLDISLAALGFTKCPSEHAVYTRNKDGEWFLLGVYVVDLIVTGASTTAIGDFKK
jgi:hypothetical protein